MPKEGKLLAFADSKREEEIQGNNRNDGDVFFSSLKRCLLAVAETTDDRCSGYLSKYAQSYQCNIYEGEIRVMIHKMEGWERRLVLNEVFFFLSSLNLPLANLLLR